jgi:hypothetical protein
MVGGIGRELGQTEGRMGRQTGRRGETDWERRRERDGEERQTGKEGKGRGGRERETKWRGGAPYMKTMRSKGAEEDKRKRSDTYGKRKRDKWGSGGKI